MTEATSHTRMAMFRRCRRLHHLHYDLGIRPIAKSAALTFGDVFHRWLECWLTIARVTGAPRWVSPDGDLVDYGEYLSDRIEHSLWSAMAQLQATDPFEAAKLRALVLAYHLRWRLQDCQVLTVEQPFDAPLINPDTGEISTTHHRHGKLDAVLQDSEGIWLSETKSKNGPADPTDDYFLRLRINSQLSEYWGGARSLGYDLQGIVYDVACKPLIEPTKATPVEDRKMTLGVGCKRCGGEKGKRGLSGLPLVGGELLECEACRSTGWKEAPHLYANQRDRDETPGEYGLRCFQLLLNEPSRYFHRVRVSRLENEIRAYEQSEWQLVRQMVRERELGEFPMNPDACWGFNMRCDMAPICWERVEPATSALYKIHKRKPATPAQPDGKLDGDVG